MFLILLTAFCHNYNTMSALHVYTYVYRLGCQTIIEKACRSSAKYNVVVGGGKARSNGDGWVAKDGRDCKAVQSIT